MTFFELDAFDTLAEAEQTSSQWTKIWLEISMIAFGVSFRTVAETIRF